MPDRKPIGKCFTRTNPWEAQTRHSIHLKRQQQAMPVDRGVLVLQAIGHADHGLLPFAQTHQRPRHHAVDGDGRNASPADVEGLLVDS